MFATHLDSLPLCVASVWDELGDDDATAIDEAFAQLYARQERFMLLADARGARIPSRALRARLSETSARFKEQRELYLAGTAVVLSSAVVAGTIGAIRWWSNKEAPVAFFTTTSEAYDWLAAKAPDLDRDELRALAVGLDESEARDALRRSSQAAR